jgi:hypothetical protein
MSRGVDELLAEPNAQAVCVACQSVGKRNPDLEWAPGGGQIGQ